MDADADLAARGVWMGLSLRHGRPHLYRSALEGVAFGVSHNLAAMGDAGAPPRRLVAVGGGTREDLWAQIVSDVTGMAQDVPTVTIGASYGDARMVADALGVDTAAWNPVAARLTPDETARPVYDQFYSAYLAAYPACGTPCTCSPPTIAEPAHPRCAPWPRTHRPMWSGGRGPASGGGDRRPGPKAAARSGRPPGGACAPTVRGRPGRPSRGARRRRAVIPCSSWCPVTRPSSIVAGSVCDAGCPWRSAGRPRAPQHCAGR